MSINNKRPPRITYDQVVDAFLDQRTATAGGFSTDGQSLFSYSLRIAEHIPDDYGNATTLVYDYTSKGNCFQSPPTSTHVGLIKQRLPRCNYVSVMEARKVGLVR